MPVYLHIGGLVAAGFDPSGAFLLVVSHSGRGVYATGSWERVARDLSLAYPEGGYADGIGPIAGLSIAVIGLDYQTGALSLPGPDGSLLHYAEGMITITSPST